MTPGKSLWHLRWLALLSLGGLNLCHADPIYKRTDKEGKVVYSSQPSHNQEKPAKLPPIVHENIDSRIQTIRAETPASCNDHGDVDCAKGFDVDGSVICLDGFRDARLPFRFACLEARLQSDKLLVVDREGKTTELAKRKRQRAGKSVPPDIDKIHPLSLLLTVRNVTGVAASDVRVSFVIPGRTPVQAEGPIEVDAYGLADYTYTLNQLSGVQHKPDQLLGTTSKVSCRNCGAVLGPKQ